MTRVYQNLLIKTTPNYQPINFKTKAVSDVSRH
uniref:Uncharacterized protein n=1 Tax=Arundo donax TaxID=35708 RepID=A0A0A9F980_ARUDO